jgi:hypothetical protein
MKKSGNKRRRIFAELLECRQLLSGGPVLVLDTLSTSGVTITGSWSTSGAGSGRYGATFLTDNNSNKGADSVVFSEVVPTTTSYQVDVRYSSIAGANNVPVTINYQGGTASVSLDETANAGEWYPIGVYPFAVGGTGSVYISNAGTTGAVLVDAVRLVGISDVPAAPPTPALTATAPNQVQLSWQAPSAGAAGYIVQRSLDSTHFTQPGQVNSSTGNFTDSTAYGSTDYTYQVVSYQTDPTGNILSFSPSANVTTPVHVPVTLYVSPTGTGTGTSPQLAAGSISAAFAIAENGDTIQMAAGTYTASQVINDKPEDAQFTSNVTVSAAPGANVVIAGTLADYAQHLTFQGLQTEGLVTMELSASYSSVVDLTDSGGIFVWGDYQSVIGCQFSVYDQDAVDICAGANNTQNHNALIEGNVVNFTLYDNLNSSQLHLDAFQLWDTYDDQIIGNIVHQTENSCVIISPGRQNTIDVENILIENNFFDNALAPATNLGLWDIDARGGTDVVVVNNTLMGGMTIVNPNQGNLLENNIIGSLAGVGEPESNNYITGYNKGIGVVPNASDIVGASPLYANASSVDYHLVLSGGVPTDVNRNPINLTFGSAAVAPATDIDNEPRNSSLVWVGAAVPTEGPVTLCSSGTYIRLDPDGQHVDVWNNASGSGAIQSQLLCGQLTSLSIQNNVAGGSLVVDLSAGSVFPARGITFVGSGSDTLTLVGSSGSHAIQISSGALTYDGNILNFSGIHQNVFDPRGGTDSMNVSSGTVTLASPQWQSGALVLNFSSIAVGSGAKLECAGSTDPSQRALLVVTSLSLAGSVNAWTGTLDLGSDDLDLVNGALSTTTNQIAEGFNSGQWNGAGITSSAAASNSSHITALGIMSNSGNALAGISNTGIYGANTLGGLFDGYSPGPTDVLIKYTYYGDANLDGSVDGSDYAQIDNGYLTQASGWFNGDLNYDGVVDGSDYTLMDNAYNVQGASFSSIIAVVPKPSVAVTAVGVPQAEIANAAASSEAPSIGHHRLHLSAVEKQASLASNIPIPNIVTTAASSSSSAAPPAVTWLFSHHRSRSMKSENGAIGTSESFPGNVKSVR